MINQKKPGKGRKHGELICRDVLLLTCTRPSRLEEEAMIDCRLPRETTRKIPVASHSHARTLRTLRMQRTMLPLTSAHGTIDWIKERT